MAEEMHHQKSPAAADDSPLLQLSGDMPRRRSGFEFDKRLLRRARRQHERVAHPENCGDQQQNEEGKQPAHFQILNSFPPVRAGNPQAGGSAVQALELLEITTFNLNGRKVDQCDALAL
jgi:hypothetical protein